MSAWIEYEIFKRAKDAEKDEKALGEFEAECRKEDAEEDQD